MSFKLRIKYQTRSLVSFLQSIQMPRWCTSAAARLVLVCLVVIMGGAYVLETSALSTSGYQIHDLEKQVVALNTEIQQLNSQVASAQSMNNIQKRLSQTAMVPVASITYVKTFTGTAVAQR